MKLWLPLVFFLIVYFLEYFVKSKNKFRTIQPHFEKHGSYKKSIVDRGKTSMSPITPIPPTTPTLQRPRQPTT